MNHLPSQLSEVVDKLHVITGTEGQCLCGTKGLSCGEILAKVSTEIRDAQFVSERGLGPAGGAGDTAPPPMPGGHLH